MGRTSEVELDQWLSVYDAKDSVAIARNRVVA
jgi:hypothetical protein